MQFKMRKREQELPTAPAASDNIRFVAAKARHGTSSQAGSIRSPVDRLPTGNVRFWRKADIGRTGTNVRFWV